MSCTMIHGLFVTIVTVILPMISGLEIKQTVDDYLNICLKGRNHKLSPGPESVLAYQCSPWKSRSCCTKETAAQMHETRRWLNFEWDHCEKPLSPRCREYFIQDLCFYECSPNVGPWIVEDVRKIRTERFRDVPLCQSECDRWWDACKDDFTCVERWDKHFNWTSGINTCPVGSSCQPFHEVYSDGNHFCEAVFGSFKVVPDSPDECFYLWFDPRYPNPNERVSRKKASSILGVPYQVETKDSGHGDAFQFGPSLLTLIIVLFSIGFFPVI